MMAACKAEAQKNKWNVSICIVDDAGTCCCSSGSTARPDHRRGSLGKARASVALRRPSKFMEDRLKERPGLLKFPAGLPIQGARAGDVSRRVRRRDRRLGRAVARGRAGRHRRRRDARLTRDFSPRRHGGHGEGIAICAKRFRASSVISVSPWSPARALSLYPHGPRWRGRARVNGCRARRLEAAARRCRPEERDERHAGDEAADMRPDGDAGLARAVETALQELQQEPEAEQDHRRHGDRAARR